MRAGGAPDVSVVTSGHDVADARLHREVAALLSVGLRVEVLGLGDAAAGPPGAYTRTWRRRGPFGRALLAAVLPWRAAGRVLFTLDPDSAVTGWVVSRIRRRRLVVDVHEDYASLLRDRSWAQGVAGRLARGLTHLATRVAAGADLTVVADAHVPPEAARRRQVVRNLPDLSMLPRGGPRGATPTALYVGDVRASRGLFAMVDAVREATAWHLDVVGPVAAADRARLEALLEEDPDLRARVRLHGRLAPRQAWERARSAWVGLLLLEDTPAFREAIPSKLYEYLGCGLAVLTSDLPRSAALVRETGAGAVLAGDGAAEVGAAAAAVLERWAADPAEVDRLRERAAAYAARLAAQPSEYERLADEVLALSRAPHRAPAAC